ncbi:hypothetical protein GCM10007049_04090 [Echinicola pacifica]|uniref:Carboxyltransferase domain-containing protein n=1 Tax=Echinicola pacifica TaxID=346377 RepID=A0A918PNQ6_9BACT|nr:biotin-dependent carboxyltransferase family protein [Echinicola pacifica]GGZ15212.1 hypothetical protein GCM10007049_04090 [Echinicola pacifica]
MSQYKGIVEVIKPGFYTSVQDLGRPGLGHWGIPISGPMDEQSYLLANHLLQNDPPSACLEMTMTGGTFKFHHQAIIVLTGANGKAHINGKAISINQVVEIAAGHELEIGPFYKGTRMYLGIKGGFKTALSFESRSWYRGLTKYFRCPKGLRIPFEAVAEHSHNNHSKVGIDDSLFENNVLDVYPGPEATEMSNGNFEALFEKSFHLSDLQNRMGIQLSETFKNHLKEILTAPVYPGTVQLTPGGKIIILMKDAQVTGGYPRILQLSPESINILAQKKPKDPIRFRLKEF